MQVRLCACIQIFVSVIRAISNKTQWNFKRSEIQVRFKAFDDPVPFRENTPGTFAHVIYVDVEGEWMLVFTDLYQVWVQPEYMSRKYGVRASVLWPCICYHTQPWKAIILNWPLYTLSIIWASAWDFQQYDILICVDSDEPLQPHFKPRNSKWCSVSSLTLIEYSSD